MQNIAILAFRLLLFPTCSTFYAHLKSINAHMKLVFVIWLRFEKLILTSGHTGQRITILTTCTIPII